MTVLTTPELRDDEHAVLELIASLRAELATSVAEPRRWSGSLRRMAFARAVQASNSIEGYNASLDDVAAVADGEPALEASEETALAVSGYRDAMTYVLQIADDQSLEIDTGLLKGLHFMMLKHDLSKNPGRWRPGTIAVRREETGEVVYEGPSADELDRLVKGVLDELAASPAPVLVRAAMAHLNLVLVHPFSDGNGRMARCLQTLVLARDQLIAPVFSSIEEFLGRNTEAYYDVLAQVGGGSWQPERDARPWLRFCLRAHYLQARTTLRRQAEIEELWNRCVVLTLENSLPERCAAGLMDAAYGLRLKRGSYRITVERATGDEISDLTSTRDLKSMVELGMLEPIGERRGRHYVASSGLLDLRRGVREELGPRAHEDPFDLVVSARQLRI